MNGLIRTGKITRSFEQFTSQINLNRTSLFEKSLFEFTTSWFTETPTFDLNTSGSTGTPKKIKVTRAQMTASAQMTLRAMELQNGDKALLCINPDYIGGKMMVVRAVIGNLHLTVVEPTSDPSQHLNENEHFDFAAMVPLQVETLLKTAKGRNLLNSITKIIIGGAAVQHDLIKQLQEIKSDVYSTYGMTETVSHIALRKLNGHDYSDSFRPLPGIEVALDERGCLKVNGRVTNHQWLTTNDVVNLASDGSFEWLGRFDNVINSGGVKIHIEQLENQITQLLTNCKFVITSREDASYGEILVMLFEGPLLGDELIGSLKTSLPKYHCPKEFIQVSQLPYNTSGKIDRKKAKEMANSSS